MWIVTVMLLTIALGLVQVEPEAAPSRPGSYLEAARQAVSWLRARAIETPHGKAWPADAARPDSMTVDLYHGVSGVVFFFLDAAKLTGEASFLADASAGSDWLLDRLESPAARAWPCGLYTGLAGLGFVLDRTARFTGEERYRAGADACLERILERAGKVDGGVEWEEGSDVIAGSAGIGLFLLDAAEKWHRPEALEMARKAGRRLVELGRPAGGGTKWPMTETYERLMPNFSHGTAGVAFFLARLGQATGEAGFIEAARSGAAYLESVAGKDDRGCLVFHHEPGGETLFYLGWCHGPPGTARLFVELSRAESEGDWMGWVRRGAWSIMASGIPETLQPGFWNNVSRCCGSAGVIDFMVGLYLRTREPRYLEFARRMADNMMARSRTNGNERYWMQAEHRVRPVELAAQTGLMQGAAGVAMSLFHLDAVLAGKIAGEPEAPWIRLPDDPF